MRRTSRLVVFFVLGLALSAQAQSGLAGQLSSLADDVVDLVARELPGGQPRALAFVGIEAEGTPIRMGALFGQMFNAKLAIERISQLGIVADPQDPMVGEADFHVRGSAFGVGGDVYVAIELVDVASGTTLGASELTLAASDGLAELLQPLGGGPGASRPDGNDAAADAVPIRAGESLSGLQLGPGDRDWYVVRVDNVNPGATLLEIFTESDLDTVIAVFGPDDPGQPFAENDDARDANAHVTVVLEESGSYYAEVRGFGEEESGSYAVATLLGAVEPDRFEPDNSLAQARRLGTDGVMQDHTLNPVGDEDWYAVALNSPGSDALLLVVETFSDMDTVLEVYDADEFLVAEDDDSGEGGNARVVVPIGASAEFFVKARQFGGGDAPGDYSIAATLEEAPVDDWEPNDSPADAGEIGVNVGPQEHVFVSSRDEDWVSFTLRRADEVVIESRGDVDIYFELYDASDNLIAEDDDSGSDYNARIQERLSPGTYYVRMSQVGEAAGQGYEVNLGSERR
jgi:hypothetical protein